MSSVPERLASIEAHLRHVRADLTELKAQGTRIGALERWRAYITGGLALVAILLGLLHLGGCHAPSALPPAHAYQLSRPVHVLIASDLPACETLAAMAAVLYWQDQGIHYLDVQVVPPEHPAVLGFPAYGEVVFTNEAVTSPTALGVTLPWYVKDSSMIHSSNIRTKVCNSRIASHELGHALGLMHSPVEGSLMFASYEKGGWYVSPAELLWIR